MRRMAYANHGASLLLLLGVSLALLSIPTAPPARAAVERDQDIDNTLAQFDGGALQMAATSNYPSVDPAPPSLDDTGAVQLAPISAIRGMNADIDLPEAVNDAGIVTIGRNIFVIGGTVSSAAVSTVRVSRVDLATGGLGAWATTTALPAVQHSNNSSYTASVAPRTQVAAAALATGQDSGYIYVVGGRVVLGGRSLSSFSLIRGTVVNGLVTTWTSLANIPFIEEIFGDDGVADASAFVATLPSGRAFLYLIGGQQSFPTGGSVTSVGSRAILWAELDPATGGLINGGASGSAADWKSTQYLLPLPNFQTDDGLWASAVVGGNFLDTNGQLKTSFYMLGGRVNTSSVTSVVLRADVGSDGTLTLSNASGSGSANATIGASVTSHAAVQYNGSVYVAGGLDTSSIPVRTVSSSYLQTDQRFPSFDPPSNSTYFLPNPTGLPEARSNHGLVAIPFPATNPTGAYVYLIGGSNTTGPATRIYRTTINNAATSNVRYPLEGYYVDRAVRLALSNARLRSIQWETEQPSGAGVRIEYRVSSDTDCSLLDARSDSQAPWSLAGTSVNGLNSFATTQAAACFQYRARLTPNFSPAIGDNATPYLLRLAIRIDVPGATDLTATGMVFRRSPITGYANGLAITIRNENVTLAGEPTLAADFGPGGPGTAPGSFFVDVFIYPPGVSPAASHTIPTNPNMARLEISQQVLRQDIRAGPNGTGFDFVIPETTPLCDYDALYNQQICTPRSMVSLFPVNGTYKIVIVVDGDNNVDEQPLATGEAEANNAYGPFNFTVASGDFPRPVQLPVVMR